MEDVNFYCPIRIGEEFPGEVELDAYHKGKEAKITMDSYKDTWKIFVFYPADFTFVCPTELEEYADMYAEFQKEGAEIFSISTDTVFVHKAWHDNSSAIGKIQFPMIADPTGDLCELFGTYIDNEGLSLRGTFILDPNNVVKTIEIHDNNIGRSAKETLRKLRAAKFVHEHGGNVCPASWEPGDDALTPSIDDVGKR